MFKKLWGLNAEVVSYKKNECNGYDKFAPNFSKYDLVYFWESELLKSAYIAKDLIRSGRIRRFLNHQVLHSCELIELNAGNGLGSLDESGLEGCNNILRKVRTNLTRKTSQMNNLTDTLKRMWYSSDPGINEDREKIKPQCKNCNNKKGHSTRYCSENKIGAKTEDDDLFAALTYDVWCVLIIYILTILVTVIQYGI